MSNLPRITPEILTGEMLLFGLVGQAIYQYADRQWLESLAAQDIFSEAPFAGENPDVIAGLEQLQAWSAANRNGMTDETFDDLRAEFTRLFAGGPGPVQAPPWESVFFSRDRLVFQQETLEVRGWYGKFGLELVNKYQEPDDHIGIEMGFIAHLAQLALAAEEAGDAARREELLQAQSGFLSDHLLRWGPVWAGLVLKYARTPFYRGLAYLTRGALTEIAVCLAIPMPPPVNIDHFTPS